MSATKLRVLWCVVALAAGARAYSSGAPQEVCADMVPKHPASPQKSPAPYTITTSSKVVKAGHPLEVVISGKSAQDTIKGFLLQAREGDNPVGQFSVAPGDTFAQLLDCGTPGSAVTHRKSSEDKRSVAFTWTPPAGFNGEIKFRATVALNGGVFWVGIESAPIKISA